MTPNENALRTFNEEIAKHGTYILIDNGGCSRCVFFDSPDINLCVDTYRTPSGKRLCQAIDSAVCAIEDKPLPGSGGNIKFAKRPSNHEDFIRSLNMVLSVVNGHS